MSVPIHSARRGTLLLFIVTHAVLITGINLFLFAQDTFRPIKDVSGGLINGTVIVGLGLMVVLVWGVCLKSGRLRPYDIGWIPQRVMAGLLFTLGLWGAAQVIHLSSMLTTQGHVTFAPAFNGTQFGATMGVLFGQLFGNALFEELAYRGFLFPQLYLRIHGSGERPWLRFLTTLIISQIIFALIHIPNRVYLGWSAGEIALDIALLTGWGVLFTLLYLRTDNIFLVTGIHALGNAPTTLFATAPGLRGAGESLVIYALAVVAVFVLPALMRAIQMRSAAAGEALPPEAWASEN